MKTLLFVNGCIRGDGSRTLRLCNDYLKKFKEKYKDEWDIVEVDLNEAEINPLDRDELIKRDQLLKEENLEAPMFKWANQLIKADHILIGAPYWDLEFPAKVKIYLERCSVTGLTFIYTPDGIPTGQCKAKELTYITTSGSPIANMNFGYEYLKGLCSLFGIEKTHFASAEGLDIIGNDVEQIMEEAKGKITSIVEGLEY